MLQLSVWQPSLLQLLTAVTALRATQHRGTKVPLYLNTPGKTSNMPIVETIVMVSLFVKLCSWMHLPASLSAREQLLSQHST